MFHVSPEGVAGCSGAAVDHAAVNGLVVTTLNLPQQVRDLISQNDKFQKGLLRLRPFKGPE